MLSNSGKIEEKDALNISRLSDFRCSNEKGVRPTTVDIKLAEPSSINVKNHKNPQNDNNCMELYTNPFQNVSNGTGRFINMIFPSAYDNNNERSSKASQTYHIKSTLHNKNHIVNDNISLELKLLSYNNSNANKIFTGINQLDYLNKNKNMNDSEADKDPQQTFITKFDDEKKPTINDDKTNDDLHNNNITNNGNNLPIFQSSIIKDFSTPIHTDTIQSANLSSNITIINNNNVTIHNYSQNNSGNFIGFKRNRMALTNKKKNEEKKLTMESVLDYYNSSSVREKKIEIVYDERQEKIMNKLKEGLTKKKRMRHIGHINGNELLSERLGKKKNNVKYFKTEIENKTEIIKEECQVNEAENEEIKVGGNKMTRKLIEENISRNCDNRNNNISNTNSKKTSSKVKGSKSTKNMNLKLEEACDPNISINYECNIKFENLF
jgi:hypothetical protein